MSQLERASMGDASELMAFDVAAAPIGIKFRRRSTSEIVRRQLAERQRGAHSTARRRIRRCGSHRNNADAPLAPTHGTAGRQCWGRPPAWWR
jgi:hypothetical protein